MRLGKAIAAAIATHNLLDTGVHGVGASVVCSEAVADAKVAAAGLYLEGTLARYQANPATGTMTNPSRLNDNSVADYGTFLNVNEYGEIQFDNIVRLNRWRRYGKATNDAGNRYSLQYYSLETYAWVDWVTDIVESTLEDWESFNTETEIKTTGLRYIITTRAGNAQIHELEVIY